MSVFPDDSGGDGGIDWSKILPSLITAGVTLYGIQTSKNQANKPPTFFVAPQTPEDKQKSAESQQLFNYMSGWADQYLKGLSGATPDYSLTPEALGLKPGSLGSNNAFMGGIKVPTIDFSKLSLGAAPPPAAPAGPGGNGGVGSEIGPGGTGKPDPNAGGDPFGDANTQLTPDMGLNNNQGSAPDFGDSGFRSFVDQWGSTLAKGVGAALSGNPIAWGVALWSAYQAWRKGGSNGTPQLPVTDTFANYYQKNVPGAAGNGVDSAGNATGVGTETNGSGSVTYSGPHADTAEFWDRLSGGSPGWTPWLPKG